MSDRTEISAMDLHGALSSLVFAVQEELGRGVTVSIRYTNSIYLQVIVECRPKDRQMVVDKLTYGILWGPFDYRFKGVSYPTMPVGEWDWIEVAASLDLSESKPPSGPINFEQTPSRQRERQQQYEWGYR